MTTGLKYIKLLVEDIHSTTVATNGTDGHPQTRNIDMMYYLLEYYEEELKRALDDFEKSILNNGMSKTEFLISIAITEGEIKKAEEAEHTAGEANDNL